MTASRSQTPPTTPGATPHLDEVLDALGAVQRRFEAGGDPRRHFVATYARTTAAVGEAVRAGHFEDPVWVDRWDAAFAQLYLDALAAHDRDQAAAPAPWRVSFAADGSLAALRLVLLGMNAHINFDLPQALLAVIDDDDFADPAIMESRRRDHRRIDDVLAARVAAEDRLLEPGGGRGRALLDRVLTPLNRAATRRLLGESRRKVWHNTGVLQAARRRGPQDLADRVAELEELSAARIADLVAPGQVLLKLASGGFGVVLPAD